MRSFLLLFPSLALFFATTACAAPAAHSVEITDQTKLLLGGARGYLTSVHATYTSTTKAIAASQSSVGKRLAQQAEDQKRARELLDSSLSTAIDELFTVDSEIAILPSIVEFTSTLVEMTEYYREQSGYPAGEETLSCGPFCKYYQDRRDALSAMIDLLQDDLLNLSGVVKARRRTVEQLASDLGYIQSHPDSLLTRFGFDHFINLRVALLESQASIVEDVHRLGTLTGFTGQPERVPSPCAPGFYSFASFQADLEELEDETVDWEAPVDDPRHLYNVGHWVQGPRGAPGPLKQLRDPYVGMTDPEGVYHPGWLDNWGACSQTKTNVLTDFRAKVEAEVRLGNLSTAQLLDEETLELQVEIDRINAQYDRLKQFSNLLEKIGSIARIHAVAPPPGEAWSDMWKSSVLSEIRNIERLSAAQREVLVATQALLRIAEHEITTLVTIDDEDERDASLFAVQMKLESLARHGFERLELELSLAAGSLRTMSENIRSSEGSNDQGGLGEAISAYERIASLRNEQMEEERDIELPLRRKQAAEQVAKLERSRADTAALLIQIEERQDTLRSLVDELKSFTGPVDRFFGVKVAHPSYLALTRKFLTDLRLTGVTARGVRRAVEEYLKKFTTTGSAIRVSSTAVRTTTGRHAKRLRGRYQRNIAAIMDEVSAPQIGGTSLSGVLRSLAEISARSDAL